MSGLPSARGEHLGDLGLADAGLAFEEQRPAELEREEHRRREAALRDVVVGGEQFEGCIDGGGNGMAGDVAGTMVKSKVGARRGA